jgi:hypothetical protein
MQDDLGLSGTQWNICLTIFFFPYCAFEIPSNVVLKLLPANLWLSILVVSWGTCMTLMSLVTNYRGLLAARFFLGFTEVCVIFFCALNFALLTYSLFFRPDSFPQLHTF